MGNNKKWLGFVGLGCGVLLLTGCGGSSNKTLTCTQNMDEQMSGLGKMEAEIRLTWDKDEKKVEEAEINMTVEVTSDEVTDEMIDSLKDTLDEQCENSDDYSSCKVKKEGSKKIVLTASGDPSKMEETDGVETDMSVEEAKKELEDAGFSCK